ncbi:MAG: hypothetical protein ND895_22855 [Pyrinomonadaceae bacterium]|nr:hypothetical protein [Pyrinomonadaceae bacterium]
MTHPQLSVLALIVAIGLCAGLASAQNSSTAEKAPNADTALREKAFNLLDSLAGQISTLQSAENRARLGSNIAESLWIHDEKRARSLFALVADDIKAGLQNQDDDDPTDSQTLMVFLRLRMDTVERIAKHDAELALAFLKATEPVFDKPPPYGVAESERALELRLAKEIAANNPDLALKLGRQSLARGFFPDLISLLKQLHRKHKEQGLILYQEIIVKLRNANLARNREVMYFAQNLANTFTPPVADEPTFRDLINIFITTALANGCGNKVSDAERSDFCRQVAALVPRMEKIDPLRTAKLKHWAPVVPEWERLRQGFDELNDLTQNGTVDEMLALAAKYPQIEGEIQMRAMVKAEASGDMARARKIANDYSSDPERRRLMLAHLDRDQMWASMNDEKMAEVQRRLSTFTRTQERVGFLLSIADRIGVNDRNTALKLLNQASGIVDTMKPGKEQTEAQMGLAMMYCLVKSDLGLSIMESLVPKLNDLVGAAAKLDGYDNRYLRDGEWNMTGEGNVGSLLTRLAQNAGYFAWFDFDRAVSLAAQFDRAELRLMAQLKLAQGILAGPPKRFMDNAPRY